MNYRQTLAPILSKENLTPHIFRFTLLCPTIAKDAIPGQFVQIRVSGFSLRRPISLAQIDTKEGIIALVFEEKGNGTQTLAQKRVGETMDILGSLGHGFTILPDAKRVLLIGGGIGTPPMLTLAQYYGTMATVISGFRSSDVVILQDDFARTGAKTILCTEDGTAGQQALVTIPAKAALSALPYDKVYACGPRVMLSSVAALCAAYSVPCEVSMEERMACGIGACLGCAIQTKQNDETAMRHVCKDGPVFDAQEVIW